MNKMKSYELFSPLYPLKGRFAKKMHFRSISGITPLRGVGVKTKTKYMIELTN